MLKVAGFDIKEEFAHLGSNRLYRAHRLSDGRPFILKTYDSNLQSARSRARISHEYEIGKLLDGDGTSRYEMPIKSGHKLVLVIEDVGGVTLREYMASAHSLAEKLLISCKIAEQLAGIHAKGIVHKDIKPENLLINPTTNEVVIIDFGLAVHIKNNGRTSHLIDAAEGSPQYFAPEQTGRVNQSVDFRSDLYALGVTLFELFAWRLPFKDENLNDLVYAQIAKQPPALTPLVPEAPKALDAVIQKLLQKSSANRYQSAIGLVQDLRECLNIVGGKASDDDFQPGQSDFSSRFLISNKLVGREAEVAQLSEAFMRVIGGGKELVLISGEPGVGKTVLVRELLPAMALQNGLFLSGKFDQQRSGTPYEGIVSALRDLAEFLMQQSEAALEMWRLTIHQALGGLSRMLIDMVPEFELVLGSQPALPEVMPEEAHARFAIGMRGLFGAISNAEHPVVLLLDDLQWADTNSLQFIQALLLDSEIRHLLLIGAFREVGSEGEGSILSSFEHLGKGFAFRHLELKAIDEHAILDLLADSFPKRTGNLQSLSALIFAKTAGNPFFVNEFLGNLFERNLFTWDDSRHAWTWDMEAIQGTQFTGNVIDYLCDRVNRLDGEVLELLKLAACIGNKFELATLAVLTGLSMREVSGKLEVAVVQNLILPDNLAFVEESSDDINPDEFFAKKMTFVHDRVREAVYSLIPDAQKAPYHLRLGEAALSHLSGEKLERNIFEIATHLNLGSSLLTEQAKRDQLAELNLKATRKATKAVAFSVAIRFAKAGIALLGPDGWQNKYDTTFALHAEHASLLFLLEDPKAADLAFQELTAKSKTRLERLQLAITHVQLLVHTGDFKQCETIGATTLAMFGIKVPAQKSLKGAIMMLVIQVKLKMMGKSEAKLLALPPVKDAETKALLEFISYLGLAFGASNAELFGFVVLYGFKLSLKHGIADPLTSYFHYYGLISLMAFGDHKAAYQYSSLSLKLFDLHPSISYKERTAFGFYGWIALWKDDVRTLILRFAEVKAKALEYGDMIIAALSEDMRLWLISLTGYPLSQVEEDCEHHLAFLSQRSEDQSVFLVRALLNAKRSLAGENPNPSSLDSDDFDFQEIRKTLLARGAENVLGGMYTKWMQLIFLFGNYEALIPIMAEGHLCIDKMANTFVPTEYYLFETLIIFQLLENKSHPQKAVLEKQLAKNLKMIATWEKRCPLNFAIFNHLVLAEQARLAGKVGLAESGYEKAIAIGEEKNWLHLTAVANELAGRLQLQQNRPQFARVFLEEARTNYLEWGAMAKVEALEAAYRELLPRRVHYSTGSLTSSSGRISTDVDLASILESSQVISSQIKVEGLLKELMAILIKNAGAEKGAFLMYQDNGIFVKARGDSSMHSPELLHGVRAFGTGLLPESVLHYVDHKRETVILENAHRSPQFGNDSYFNAHNCLSVMMVPVVKEGRMLGIIYLENNQSPGVFTPERVQVVQMLAGQIAVSIDNAMVYENLEHLVDERTLEISQQKDKIIQQNEALENEKRKSDSLLLNILPKEIADELKATGKAKAQRFPMATVMFTDIVGFTQLAEKMFPEELVQELDICFSAFDRIQRKYGMEKVKTIGDAYMCMAGVPVPHPNSPVIAVLAALEMQATMAKLASERKGVGASHFEMRLGMHSGEIVAGVVGTEKFAYDIWGDTVNVAARLESAGEAGKVNVSEETYALVKDYFDCEYRGKISVKSKTDIGMYFVSGLKEKGMRLLEEIEGRGSFVENPS